MIYFKIADLLAAAQVLLSTFPNNSKYDEYFTVPLSLADRIFPHTAGGFLGAEIDEHGTLSIANSPDREMPNEVWKPLSSLVYGLFFSGENNRGPFTVNFVPIKPRHGKGVPPAIANRVANGDVHDMLYLAGMFGFDFMASVGGSLNFPQIPAPVHVRLVRASSSQSDSPTWALTTVLSAGKGESISLYRA